MSFTKKYIKKSISKLFVKNQLLHDHLQILKFGDFDAKLEYEFDKFVIEEEFEHTRPQRERTERILSCVHEFVNTLKTKVNNRRIALAKHKIKIKTRDTMLNFARAVINAHVQIESAKKIKETRPQVLTDLIHQYEPRTSIKIPTIIFDKPWKCNPDDFFVSTSSLYRQQRYMVVPYDFFHIYHKYIKMLAYGCKDRVNAEKQLSRMCCFLSSHSYDDDTESYHDEYESEFHHDEFKFEAIVHVGFMKYYNGDVDYNENQCCVELCGCKGEYFGGCCNHNHIQDIAVKKLSINKFILDDSHNVYFNTSSHDDIDDMHETAKAYIQAHTPIIKIQERKINCSNIKKVPVVGLCV